MSKWDKDYINLCKKILKEGTKADNRTGIPTIKLPAYFLEFDLQKEFPILSIKECFYKKALTEILWIYKLQSNDVRELQKRSNHIWDEWMVDSDGIYRLYDNRDVPFTNNTVDVIDLDGKKTDKKAKSLIPGKTIIKAIDYGKEYAYTIGTAYGFIVKEYKLIDKLIKNLKENKNTRRLVLSLWQDKYLKTAVLPSCVWSTEWDVTGDKLNLLVHQRSCDVPLGLPFNFTQYAILLSMIAQVTNLKPGKMYWSIKDAHIYENQVDGIKELIKREKLPDLKAPSLYINPDIKDFYDFDDSNDNKDIKILNYKHHGKINFKIAQ